MSDKTTPVTMGAAVLGLVTAVLTALVAFGVRFTPEQQAAVLGLASAALLAASVLWSRWGIARSHVVEQTSDGTTVVAGEANELPTGAIVREDLGERDPEPRHALQEDL